MPKMGRGLFLPLTLAASAFLLWGCANPSNDAGQCVPTPAPHGRVAGSSGSALVFIPDPRIASGDPKLSPKSDLDPYRTRVRLSRLSGRGVLLGQYVDVRTNSGSCPEEYGALTTDNKFEYSQRDTHFAEAMSYYYGDHYQAALSEAGVQVASSPIHIVAHCMHGDNAFYQVSRGDGGVVEEKVCLGDSLNTPGASYGDDAYVIVHELQHATTSRHYSLSQWLGEFPYDEAGALNEGISDFMALMHLSPLVPDSFDPRIFSSWALGTFVPQKLVRGAHKCPAYDPSWPSCDRFPSFDGSKARVSYMYPDGLEWPYADNFSRFGSKALISAFMNFNTIEEIHSDAVIVEGALWDVYQSLLGWNEDAEDTRELMMKLVVKAVEDLPKPDSEHLSPVNFREFASSLMYVAREMELPRNEVAGIGAALETRGLLGGPRLDSSWAAAGAGMIFSPGLLVVDDVESLRRWLKSHGLDGSMIHDSPHDGKLTPGKTAVVWFDLQNVSLNGQTAGGVMLTVKSLDPDVTFVPEVNPGWISSSKTQILYSKINGNQIVSSLGNLSDQTDALISSAVGSDYFSSISEYRWEGPPNLNLTTGIWVQVSAAAPHGKTVSFQVDAKPSNGESSRVKFDATLE